MNKTNTDYTRKFQSAEEVFSLIDRVTLDKRLSSVDVKIYNLILSRPHGYTQENMSDFLGFDRSIIGDSMRKLQALRYIFKMKINGGPKYEYVVIPLSENPGIPSLKYPELAKMINLNKKKTEDRLCIKTGDIETEEDSVMIYKAFNDIDVKYKDPVVRKNKILQLLFFLLTCEDKRVQSFSDSYLDQTIKFCQDFYDLNDELFFREYYRKNSEKIHAKGFGIEELLYIMDISNRHNISVRNSFSFKLKSTGYINLESYNKLLKMDLFTDLIQLKTSEKILENTFDDIEGYTPKFSIEEGLILLTLYPNADIHFKQKQSLSIQKYCSILCSEKYPDLISELNSIRKFINYKNLLLQKKYDVLISDINSDLISEDNSDILNKLEDIRENIIVGNEKEK